MQFEKDFLRRLSINKDYGFFDLPELLGKPAHVMVKPEVRVFFETVLADYGFDYTLVNDDLRKPLEEFRPISNRSRVTFSRYLRFSEINAYLDELSKSYSNRVFVKTVGKSYEGRDMQTITITNGDGRSNKKVIFVDACVHAREWITPACAVYIINQLVENFTANAQLLKDYDWIVLPVVNPDGYEYTHLSHDNIKWRKTRKPVDNDSIGTDPNRNFDFHWGEIGASTNACEEVFKGLTAFSEPETKIVRDLMHSLSGRAKMYLTIHSCAQSLIYPWGYTSELPSSWRDLDEVAQAGAAAIKAATGTEYSVGSSANVLGAAAGGSDDYAFAKANIPISITVELPSGRKSYFHPELTEIEPLVSEAWIGIKAMAEKVIEKY